MTAVAHGLVHDQRKIHGGSSCRSRPKHLVLPSAWRLCILSGFCHWSAFVGGLRPYPVPRGARDRTSRKATPTSNFHGVSWHEGTNQWQAHVKDPVSGRPVSLGIFGSERDAAMAFDGASLVIDGKTACTNFPGDSYSPEYIRDQEFRLKNYWRPRPSSKYHGVYRTRGSSKWKVDIELHGVKQFLDDFADEVEAANAADDALRSTGIERALRLQKLNFKRESDYFDPDTWGEEAVPRDATSCFIGVSYHLRTGQYLVKLGRKHVGLFDTELEAARAFDEASRAVGGITNFTPVSG
mmetsp:Transcript_2141/g.2476  ORF Transcript_2141/g.2476 Transcript_2141/m.2476 type:complete len:296 (-) Transcript_2141:116-1003(-)